MPGEHRQPELDYAYSFLVIPIHVGKGQLFGEHRAAEKVREVLLEVTQGAALDGWQVDVPLELSWLQSNGCVQYPSFRAVMGLAPARVSIRMKRLRGPGGLGQEG